MRIVTYATGNINDPVFWLVFSSDKPLQSPTVTVMDEYGAELNPTGPNISSYMQRRSGMSPVRIAPYSIGSQAPHGKIVGICFYSDSSKTKKIAQLMIPGECLAPIPATNSTLPVVKTAGELSVELTSLVTSLKAVPHSQSRATNEFFTQARFRMRNNSGATREWSAESIKIFAPDGTASRVANINGFVGDDLIVNFDRHLDSNMPCNFEIQLSPPSDSLDFGFALNRDLYVTFQAIPTRFQGTSTTPGK